MPNRFGFGITNLGRLDFKNKYKNFEIQRCYFYPHTEPKTEGIISAVTVAGKLSFGVFSKNQMYDTEKINDLKSNIISLLNNEIRLDLA